MLTPKVNVNLNYDGKEFEKRLTRWIPRHIIHRFDHEEVKRRKLLAMARECASLLKLPGWDLVLWDSNNPTLSVLEILAASTECSTPEGTSRMALYFANCPSCRREFELISSARLQIDLKEVERFQKYDQLETITSLSIPNVEKIRREIQWFLSGISSIEYEECWVQSSANEATGQENLKNQLEQTAPLIEKLGIATDLKSRFNLLRRSALAFVSQCKLPEKQLLNLSVTKTIICFIDMLALENLAGQLEINLLFKTVWLSNNSIDQNIPLDGMQVNLDRILRKVESVSEWLHVQFSIEFLLAQYRSFLCNCLEQNNAIGDTTNFLRLRQKHFFNNHESDDLALDHFIRKLPNVGTASKIVEGTHAEKPIYDFLTIMNEVLGGRREKSSNLKVSIAERLVGAEQIEKNSFLRKINRRHVRLVECANDRALVIPYLDKIFLELNDKQWLRDFDIKALQPCRGIYCGAAARRTANILLAFEYPEAGEPVVNETAFKLIRKYAKKGKLYSRQMRDHILSVMLINSRVDVLALTATAREVFEDDHIMVAALVRETIHDRVLMKSSFPLHRIKHEGVPHENDAYYSMCYIKRNYSAKNNILWRSGVSLYGLHFNVTGIQTGSIEGEEVIGVSIPRSRGQKLVKVWFSKEAFSCSDIDGPSAYVQVPEAFDSSIYEFSEEVQVPFKLRNFGAAKIGADITSFPDIKLGSYCTVQSEIRSSKRRRIQDTREAMEI